MANVKISELTELTVPADDDEIAIVDKNVVTTKKITRGNLYSDATSSAKGLATAAQITELESNVTHRTSNGSDHTYISQDVSSGSSPTLDGANITNIDADTLFADVKEANASAVKKGQACAIVGSSGDKFEVQLADCNNVNLLKLLGISDADVAQDGEGTVIHKGLLTHVDTRTSNTYVNPNAETWAAGNLLYLSTIPGGLTNVQPSGRCVIIGYTQKGNSISDTLLAVTQTDNICTCAAPGEDICHVMGDSVGVNKVTFKNYADAEKAAFDSYGNLTLSGTVDGIDIATDVAANTAKVTNATHTGDVTGSGALTIGADKVLDSHINWGTGANQVSAVDIPIADAGAKITATETEGALQENRTAIDLNTAKETNATHTGDVTGSTALTIGAGKVTEAMQVLADNTTQDFSTTKHGYVPKGTNTGDFLKDDGTWDAPAGTGDALTTDPLSQFAATTSAQLAGVISNETGSGALVFGTSPALTTPTGIVASDLSDFDTEVANNSAVAANTAKETNATHTGEATGSGALTIDKTAISNKGVVSAVGSDYVLIGDTSDTDNLKKALISDFASAGGDMAVATYDPATIAEQLVGLTATQTLTNKTLTQPTLTLNQSATPTPTVEGDIQWDTDGNNFAVGDGSGTKIFSDDAVVEARANHTGTQAASTISDFDTEVANNSAVTANTAKDTNATHTGDVTGSEALTIATDAVDIPMLSASGTADGTTYLRGDNTWSTPSGSGDVSKVGTPVDNQVGVWTGDGTIEGTSGLTYSGTVLDLAGNLTLSGTVDGIDIATDVAANMAKATNVTTNLSEGTSTTTTVDVNSSDGTNATLVAASTTRAGVLTKAKFDEIVVNTAKTGVTDEISNVVEDTTPQLGGTLEINEKAILIDAVLSTDHTWTGPTQLITAGENLAIFETAYLKSDGKYWRIDADAEATAKGKIVMATAAITADATGIVLLPGEFSFIRDDSTTEWTVTAAGDTMFLGLTAGELTNDISGYTTGDIGRVAGYMETATILNFNVDKTWIKI